MKIIKNIVSGGIILNLKLINNKMQSITLGKKLKITVFSKPIHNFLLN